MRTLELWAVILVAAALLSGCQGAISPEGRRLLATADAAYRRGDDAAAIQASSRFLQVHPRLEEAGEAHYLRGVSRLRSKDAVGGKADLLAAVKLAKRQDLLALAHVKLGELAYGADDMPQAESHYRSALEQARPGAPPADEAMYRLGCVLQRLGRWGEADQHFDRLIYLFEGTEAAKRAQGRVRAVRWSVQAGAFEKGSTAAAERLSADLNRTGLFGKTRVDVELRQGRLMRLVRVGSYQTYDAARADPLFEKVRAIRPDAFITAAR